MEIHLENLGKRYIRNWVFRHLNFTIRQGEKVAITGSNGSGKSTLIQIISGARTISEGRIEYRAGGQKLDPEFVFRRINFAAPYTQSIEELNLRELIRFHSEFRPITKGMDFSGFLESLSYDFKPDQQIKFFSSGMKQRVKIGMALFFEASAILLDEPTSNLDADGKEWYARMLKKYAKDRTLIIASNDPLEYQLCDHMLKIEDFI